MIATAEARTTAIRSPDDLGRIVPAWNALLARCPRTTIFDTPDWLLPAAATFPVEPLVVVVQAGDALLGVLPLARCRVRGLRTIRALGSGGSAYSVSDYLGATAIPGAEQTLAAAAVDVLCREPWDVLDLQEVAADSVLGDAILAALGKSSCHLAVEISGHSHRLSLPPSWSAYVLGLSRNMREVLERKDRKLEREHHVQYRLVTDAGELPLAMQHLFDLHTARWQQRGEAGIFRSEHLQRFHLAVARRALERGALDLSLLIVDGRPLAVDYGFRLSDTHFFYAAGFDPSPQWARYSLGSILRGRSIQRAIADGVKTYDFLRGDREYKQRYGTEAIPHRRLRIFRSAALYQGWRVARVAKQAARSLRPLGRKV